MGKFKFYLIKNPDKWGVDAFIENLDTNEIIQKEFANWYIKESNFVTSPITAFDLIFNPLHTNNKRVRDRYISGGISKGNSIIHHNRITPYFSDKRKGFNNEYMIMYYIIETIDIFHYTWPVQTDEIVTEYRNTLEKFKSTIEINNYNNRKLNYKNKSDKLKDYLPFNS